MSIQALQGIQITEEDIDEAEHILGDIAFDQTRREIIKDLGDADVQAFPGTGKTTLLIAKLAILAKKWPYTHKGICILSHTNVAREEIENRLGKTVEGKKLMMYPHFIGTVHSFCNSFISLPWLRSNGYPIRLIDQNIVLERRWKQMKKKNNTFLNSRVKDKVQCEATDFPVSLKLKCEETCGAYQTLKKIVECSLQDGYFTYNEMLYIARHAILQNAAISKAIQNRFSLLMIDEAQDTYPLQWEILRNTFQDRSLSVKQYFGDYNQAIFHGNENITIDRERTSKRQTIVNSHRFGPGIAKLVDPLAYEESGLQGEYRNSEKSHTIFLFTKDRIHSVLDVYAEHLLASFTDEELNGKNSLKCYAVGLIHNGVSIDPSDKHFPRSIVDYWPQYRHVDDKTCVNLLSYLQTGKAQVEKAGDYWAYVESLSSALIRIVNKYRDRSNCLSTYGCALRTLLKQLPHDQQRDFKIAVLEITRMPFGTQEEWENLVGKVCNTLKVFFRIDIRQQLPFFEWSKQEFVGNEEKDDKRENVYVYRDQETGRTVKIHIGSIHSVKGQTHLATMALETYLRDHNIKNILPWLCCQNSKKKSTNAHRLRCHYVALSRAREMINIAIPKEFVSDKVLKLLTEQGWNIVNV